MCHGEAGKASNGGLVPQKITLGISYLLQQNLKVGAGSLACYSCKPPWPA